jgi:hypothetical protein
MRSTNTISDLKVDPKSAQPTVCIPVRLNTEDHQALKDLKDQTGLSQAEIIRRGLRLALPLFKSGEKNPLNYPTMKAEENEPTGSF